MPFKGPYPTVFGGNTPAMLISHTTFSGDVTNTGTIGAGGISVISGAFLSGGGLFDSGVIVGGIKVDSGSKIVAADTENAIAVVNTETFGGGISNAGKITATHHHDGVLVGSVSTFSGGIRNRGTIVAGTYRANLSNGAALPPWLQFDASTLTFSGMVPYNAAGLSIVVSATNTSRLTTSETFAVQTPPPAPPTVTNQTGTQCCADGGVNFTLASDTFTDPSGGTLAYAATLSNGAPLPSWLNFDPTTETRSAGLCRTARRRSPSM
jgi:hypothetical protein